MTRGVVWTAFWALAGVWTLVGGLYWSEPVTTVLGVGAILYAFRTHAWGPPHGGVSNR